MRRSISRRSIVKGIGGAGAAGLAGCLGTGGDGSQGLNVLTWSGYEGVAEMIEEEEDTSVNLKLISSDVDGFNTLQGGGTEQFDVLLLDNTWAIRNANADTIKPVKKEDYPSVDNWIEQFSWPYDTFTTDDQMWAVPPRWGWGGAAYNEDEVDNSTFEDGYDPVWNGEFEGELTLPDWPTWVIPLILLELGHDDPYAELSQDELDELMEVMVQMFESATAIHSGASGVREDFIQGNATITFGIGNFGLSQLAAEGYDNIKLAMPADTGGWYWTEGLCLVNNPNLNRELANKYINKCLTPEGQYSICYEDAESKGAPINEEAFDQFSEEEQKTIMMYEDKGFEAIDEILDQCIQYNISPQQDTWLDMWSEAKARGE